MQTHLRQMTPIKGGNAMKEKRNVHLKVQELCDCYATTDPLKEMSIVKDDREIVTLKFPE